MRPRPLPPDTRRAFAVLGVLPEHGPDAARRAFRRLALRCHPDRQGGTGDGAAFRRLRAAHDLVMAWHAGGGDEPALPADVAVVWPVPPRKPRPQAPPPRQSRTLDLLLAALLLGWGALGLLLRL